VKLVWRGDEVADRVRRAATAALSETVAAAAAQAKANHPLWRNRTGLLEASIQVFWVRSERLRVSASWGSMVPYALYQEIGTSRIGPRAKQRLGPPMWEIPGPFPADGVPVVVTYGVFDPRVGKLVDKGIPHLRYGPLMHPHPYLRPAATTQYGLLAQRLSYHYRTGV
jgi:hypothetical protein